MFRMGEEEVDAVRRVLMSHDIFRFGGKFAEVNHFEQEFAQKMGTDYVLCLASGTGALTASLAALGIGPGDEVIVPGYTFIATALAPLAVGAIPVVAEINETMTMDMEDVEKKISPHTKAVIPVHIQGFPSNMDKLLELQKKYGFAIVEDACQADGGSYHGKRLGTIGDCGAFSFNYFKIISAGEGGAMVTNRADVFQRATIWHDCGTAYWRDDLPGGEPMFIGTNMRVSEITGAILRVQLTRLDGILKDLRKVKNIIRESVSDLKILRPNPSNDAEGDCGGCLPFIFDDVDTAIRFEQGMGGTRPINTGKHVYREWTPIIEKRGAYNHAFNPYENPANAGLNMDTRVDSCPVTLDILSRTVYQGINCDWTEQEIDNVIQTLRNAAKAL